METIQEIIENLQNNVINPLIGLMFAIATLIFLIGVINYVIGSKGDQKKLDQGKKVMTWGIIGMFIMVSAWGIVRLLCTFFGTCS